MPFFKEKKVLVTGANGFVGRYLMQALLLQGARIGALDRSFVRTPSRILHIKADLVDQNRIQRVIKAFQPEIVFHLAADKTRSADFSAFDKSLNVNLMGSLNLFSALKGLKNLRSIVVIGTAEEYGENASPFRESMREKPISSYSFSKLCQSKLCEVLSDLHQMPFVIVRPTLTYGPGQGNEMFLPSLITRLIQNKPFPMTTGQQTRDYLFITDLIDALLKIPSTRFHPGTILNLGSGKPIKILTLARLVETMLGKKGLIKPGERLYRPNEIMKYIVDHSRATRSLNWRPKISLAEGLRRTIDDYKRERPT